MNPLYEMFNGGMNRVAQAMQNPAEFVCNAFPDIPPYMRNDPNQILRYLQQTRNISNQQIQNIINRMPRF